VKAPSYLKKGLGHKDPAPAKKLVLDYEMAVTYKQKGKLRRALISTLICLAKRFATSCLTDNIC
jgi:hypothetical protein